MDYSKLKTFTGLTLAEILLKLDEELPVDAYTAVPGGSNLTDIDPNYGTEALNKIFGLSGVGWGTEFQVEDMSVIHGIQKTSSGYERPVITTTVRKMIFWYMVVDEAGKETKVTIPSVGASTNDKEEYSLKGALTYALGAAMSKIGWQSSVYKGLRSHVTVKQKKTSGTQPTATPPSPASKPAAAAGVKSPAPAAQPVGKPAQAPTASVPVPAPAAVKPAATTPVALPESQPVVEGAGSIPKDFVVPMGSRKGTRLGDCTQKELEFYAKVNAAAGSEMAKLKDFAQLLIASQSA